MTKPLNPDSLRLTKQFLPGQMIGRYRVISGLGVGGMGEVYLARDIGLRRYVALKVLPETSANDPRMKARFDHEAHILAALNHPNIASIHDLEEFSQGQCLVLEFVNGETLEGKLRRGPLPVQKALPIFAQIASALEAAHRGGIIHRDLKPANIKITSSGEIKVLDFGIAKILRDDQSEENLADSEKFRITTKNEVEATMTDPGKVIGTVPYMSPEQTRGEAIDLRTDLWAFGCVLFEALTGHMPFEGASVIGIVAAINSDEPDWQLLPRKTPPVVCDLLRQLLQKDPSQRLSNAVELRNRLEAVINGSQKKTQVIRLPEAQPTPPLSFVKRHSTAALVMLVAILVGILGWKIYQQARTVPAEKRLVVVSFKELDDSKDKFFGERLARQLGANLAGVPGLQIIDQALPSPETKTRWIVKKLKATLILRGTVWRSAKGVSIDYTLHNAKEVQIIRGSVSHADLSGALDKVTEQVAQALGLAIPPTPEKTPNMPAI